MNKTKLIVSMSAVLIIFLAVFKISKKPPEVLQDVPKESTIVSVKSAAESKTFSQKIQLPANVVGDQEIKITAKSSGTIVIAPNNIGAPISAGSLLAKIEDAENLESNGNFNNLQTQQAEISAEQAKKNYGLTKDVYKDLQDSSSSTRVQRDNAKAQRDIAKLQYENALLGLTGSTDNHIAISPISGVITNKAVSVGDSVSLGQLIATVSKSSKIKVQFFVDSSQQKKLMRGQKIYAVDDDGSRHSLLIQSIAITADQTTKRFLIEAYPEKYTPSLLSGTIINVLIEIANTTQKENHFILLLSAISIGQNENFIFVAENNIAKKKNLSIVDVNGETAEISIEALPETLFIVDGNKLLADGENIVLQN